jgi:hypothetical protein
MDDRGTGRTTEQLKKAMSHLAKGQNIAFVCRTYSEAHHTAALMASIIPPDKKTTAYTLHYGPSVIRMKPITSDIDGIKNWKGRIIFDHHARPEIGASDREWRVWDEWKAVAMHINSKERSDG